MTDFATLQAAAREQCYRAFCVYSIFKNTLLMICLEPTPAFAKLENNLISHKTAKNALRGSENNGFLFTTLADIFKTNYLFITFLRLHRRGAS
jgi:hypothetical protein